MLLASRPYRNEPEVPWFRTLSTGESVPGSPGDGTAPGQDSPPRPGHNSQPGLCAMAVRPSPQHLFCPGLRKPGVSPGSALTGPVTVDVGVCWCWWSQRLKPHFKGSNQRQRLK